MGGRRCTRGRRGAPRRSCLAALVTPLRRSRRVRHGGRSASRSPSLAFGSLSDRSWGVDRRRCRRRPARLRRRGRRVRQGRSSRRRISRAPSGRSAHRERRQRTYFALLFAFWAVLLAVPLAGNLGVAWLLIEATTAASALLVGFSGQARALEAGWKYLILTSLGLGVALLGIVVLAAGIPSGGLGALSWHALATYSSGSEGRTRRVRPPARGSRREDRLGAGAQLAARRALRGAAAGVGAALGGAAPAVLLVAWRSEQSLAPVVGTRPAQDVLIGFGLVSLAVAVPFLWRSLPWKRLLAYSSLEHMGVIALGIGFGDAARARRRRRPHRRPRASRRRSASTPRRRCSSMSRAPPSAPSRASRARSPRSARRMGISLGALAGLPPSPLFVSEVLIVAGGFEAGRLGGRRRGGAARARLPRPRSRAARDHGRQGPAPRCCATPRPARARRSSAAPRSCCCSALSAVGALAARLRRSSTRSLKGIS